MRAPDYQDMETSATLPCHWVIAISQRGIRKELLDREHRVIDLQLENGSALKGRTQSPDLLIRGDSGTAPVRPGYLVAKIRFAEATFTAKGGAAYSLKKDHEFAFRANVKLEKVGRGDLAYAGAAALKRLAAFPADWFDIVKLFLRMGKSAEPDWKESRLPDFGDHKDDFLALMRKFLDSLADQQNPFVFTYAPLRKESTNAGPLDPTAVRSAVVFNQNNPALSTLNLLMMTDGKPFVPDPPPFTSLLVSGDADAALAIAEEVIVPRFVIPQVLSAAKLDKLTLKFSDGAWRSQATITTEARTLTHQGGATVTVKETVDIDIEARHGRAHREVFATDDGSLYATTYFNVLEKWNGTTWVWHRQLPDELRQVSMGRDGSIWGIDGTGRCFRIVGEGKPELAGTNLRDVQALSKTEATAMTPYARCGDATARNMRFNGKGFEDPGGPFPQFPWTLAHVTEAYSNDSIMALVGEKWVALYPESRGDECGLELRSIALLDSARYAAVNVVGDVFDYRGGTEAEVVTTLKAEAVALDRNGRLWAVAGGRVHQRKEGSTEWTIFDPTRSTDEIDFRFRSIKRWHQQQGVVDESVCTSVLAARYVIREDDLALETRLHGEHVEWTAARLPFERRKSFYDVARKNFCSDKEPVRDALAAGKYDRRLAAPLLLPYSKFIAYQNPHAFDGLLRIDIHFQEAL